LIGEPAVNAPASCQNRAHPQSPRIIQVKEEKAKGGRRKKERGKGKK
jgi:hypothetical protein